MPTTLARHTDPETSHDAAESVLLSPLQATCLAAIAKAPLGLTSEELARVTGISLVTVSPRLRPLAIKGLIYEHGKRPNSSGRQAIVWFSTQAQPTLF